MARNWVLFPKKISLDDFFSAYGTEDQCFDALYRWRWPNGFVCPHCGHDRCCQLSTRKLQQCNRCHRQTSVTAGTIFAATKLPLTMWFQAMYLMTQDKKCVSARRLCHRLGISYNAAWRIKDKLKQVMTERETACTLSVVGSNSTIPISGVNDAGASAVVARSARHGSSPPSRSVKRDSRCG